MKLARNYQTECINKIISNLSDPTINRALLVAPCGSGKTFMATEVIKHLLATNHKVLFLVHLQTLIDQCHEEFKVNGIKHGVIKAGWKEELQYHLQLGSVQTLNRRSNWQELGFDVVVLDEVHETIYNKGFRNWLSNNLDIKILGLTATPYRLKRSESLADIFHDPRMLVTAPTRKELMVEGHLVKETVYYSLAGADISKVATSMGDFKTPELSIVCNREDLIHKILKEYQQKTPNLSFLGFCVDINHAENCTRIFKANGINCELVTGSTPLDVRRKLYDDFDKGKLTGLFSVDVLSIGFDKPNAQVGLMLRPTQSKALWLQQVGRVERSCPGKNYAVILDQAGNTHRHGRSEDELEITLDTLSEKPQKGQAPVKTCKECGKIHPISVRQCDNCFYEFPIKQSNKVYQKSELTKYEGKAQPLWFKDLPLGGSIEVVDNPSIRESTRTWFKGLIDSSNSKKMVTAKVMQQAKAKGLTLVELQWIGKQLDHKPGWAWFVQQSFKHTA